jgi:hypothetical protein
MKIRRVLWRSNLKIAKIAWGALPRPTGAALKDLTGTYNLSVALGDVQLINQRWYVTHAGLLRLSCRKHCHGIHLVRLKELCDSAARRWAFKATVFPSSTSKGFVGYGDAEPSNVSSAVFGAELRIAETRAVNRALRKAYGIGICSVEELGSSPSADPAPKPPHDGQQHRNGSSNGQPRLRDRLCILIRQHSLDATLVKAYAADFCGTATLSAANRELVESFISHLSAAAKENRDGLICKLNSYAQPQAANQ